MREFAAQFKKKAGAKGWDPVFLSQLVYFVSSGVRVRGGGVFPSKGRLISQHFQGHPV